MAMPKALAAYWRKHGRSSSGRKKSSSSKGRRSTAIVHHHHGSKAVAHKRSGRRGRGGVGFGELASARVLIPVAVLAAAYGYSSQNMQEFADALHKIPGVKTYGAPLVIGGIALGINRYVYPNKWLRLIAAVGLTLAAYQWGKVKFDVPSWTGNVSDVDGTVADVR